MPGKQTFQQQWWPKNLGPPQSSGLQKPREFLYLPSGREEGSPASKSGLNSGLPPALPKGSLELDLTHSREIKVHTLPDSLEPWDKCTPTAIPTCLQAELPSVREHSHVSSHSQGHSQTTTAHAKAKQCAWGLASPQRSRKDTS